MKLAIMQPYLFPYIGYFQLIRAVDRFVVHDDVQWIKGGWINRNRILVEGQPQYVALPVKKDSSLARINQRRLASDGGEGKKSMLRKIEAAYRKAPCFEQAYPLVSDCLASEEEDLSLFVTATLRKCCRYLGIDTPFVASSDIAKDDRKKGQERVIEIAKAMGASHYINPIGGLGLYDKRAFSEHGMSLSFLATGEIAYSQFGADHVPSLSIIDVMMCNPPERIGGFLERYELV